MTFSTALITFGQLYDRPLVTFSWSPHWAIIAAGAFAALLNLSLSLGALVSYSARWRRYYNYGPADRYYNATIVPYGWNMTAMVVTLVAAVLYWPFPAPLAVVAGLGVLVGVARYCDWATPAAVGAYWAATLLVAMPEALPLPVTGLGLLLALFWGLAVFFAGHFIFCRPDRPPQPTHVTA